MEKFLKNKKQSAEFLGMTEDQFERIVAADLIDKTVVNGRAYFTTVALNKFVSLTTGQ
jgi:hypothetical protein